MKALSRNIVARFRQKGKRNFHGYLAFWREFKQQWPLVLTDESGETNRERQCDVICLEVLSVH
jgi:hypothetical protein